MMQAVDLHHRRHEGHAEEVQEILGGYQLFQRLVQGPSRFGSAACSLMGVSPRWQQGKGENGGAVGRQNIEQQARAEAVVRIELGDLAQHRLALAEQAQAQAQVTGALERQQMKTQQADGAGRHACQAVGIERTPVTGQPQARRDHLQDLRGDGQGIGMTMLVEEAIEPDQHAEIARRQRLRRQQRLLRSAGGVLRRRPSSSAATRGWRGSSKYRPAPSKFCRSMGVLRQPGHGRTIVFTQAVVRLAFLVAPLLAAGGDQAAPARPAF